MPDIDFVLPLWLYWSGLLLFPIIALILVKRSNPDNRGQVNLGVSYLILITGGFLGLHRFYARNILGGLYLIPFISILIGNALGRSARESLSHATTDLSALAYKIELFQQQLAKGHDVADRLAVAEQNLTMAKSQSVQAADALANASMMSGSLAGLIFLGLLIDAVLLPRLIARARLKEAETHTSLPEQKIILKENHKIIKKDTTGFIRRGVGMIEQLSRISGEYVAWWSVIAVFVYYYEVIARYVFNSPTNWAHEAMFLMFGMQYLISGAYAYLADSHVRVDVFYARLSQRSKAITNLITAVFFFIFAGTLMGTGFIFMQDSFGVFEVSFTEWAVEYWPVKATIFIGAVLILLQGFAKLVRDIEIIICPSDRAPSTVIPKIEV